MFFKKKEETSSSAVYTDQNLGISVQLPAGWEVSNNQYFELFIVAPAEHGYRANIGFNSGTLEPPTIAHLEQLFEEAYQQQKQTQTNYKSLAVDRFKVDGAEALLRQTERTIDSAGLNLTQLQVLILSPSEMVFSISASTLKQDEAKYIPLLKQIVHSINFNQA